MYHVSNVLDVSLFHYKEVMFSVAFVCLSALICMRSDQHMGLCSSSIFLTRTFDITKSEPHCVCVNIINGDTLIICNHTINAVTDGFKNVTGIIHSKYETDGNAFCIIHMRCTPCCCNSASIVDFKGWPGGIGLQCKTLQNGPENICQIRAIVKGWEYIP